MPRKAKRTMSGDPAGPARAPVGVPYGEGERALESQRRMPVPDFAQGAAAPSPGPASAGGGTTPPADAFAQAMAQAQAMAPPASAIAAPTERPDEPITAGAGQPMPMTDPAVYELRALAKAFDYPDLMRFLERIERSM